MARKTTTANQQHFLEQVLSELAVLIQDFSPQAEVEITYEQYEDEDAHVYIYPPPDMTAEAIDNLEVAIGERCNEILLEMGLFIISAVCD